MIKKLIALAATALFSLNAAAGYVRYDLDYGSSGGLRGFIVQHDTDHSIAHFDFWLYDEASDWGHWFWPLTGEGSVLLDSASTHFRNGGPTNFTIYDDFGSDHNTSLSVTFARTTNGNFTYTAHYSVSLWVHPPWDHMSGRATGLATKGTMDPDLAEYLDSWEGYHYGVPRIVPHYIKPHAVSEPTSIALLAVGAAGLAGASRRRKPAQ